jgi:Aspartate amino-transferase
MPSDAQSNSTPCLLGAPTELLRAVRSRMLAGHAALRSVRLSLNIARGKPAMEQVALADRLLATVTRSEDCIAEDGTDCRNYYGSPQGLIETRRLFAPILGAPPAAAELFVPRIAEA